MVRVQAQGRNCPRGYGRKPCTELGGELKGGKKSINGPTLHVTESHGRKHPVRARRGWGAHRFEIVEHGGTGRRNPPAANLTEEEPCKIRTRQPGDKTRRKKRRNRQSIQKRKLKQWQQRGKNRAGRGGSRQHQRRRNEEKGRGKRGQAKV